MNFVWSVVHSVVRWLLAIDPQIWSAKLRAPVSRESPPEIITRVISDRQSSTDINSTYSTGTCHGSAHKDCAVLLEIYCL